jgi:hypothetical protein
MPTQHHAGSDSAKPGAPIAQVLNDTTTTQHVAESSLAIHIPPAAPFSGKLVDLLLDTSEQLRPTEWRRTEQQYEELSRVTSDNPVIKLPQPPQLPAKTAERARIPPLLQGLHQPPPLPPSGRLFPPITDGASGFEQDIRDRIQSANASQEARIKRKRDDESKRSVEPGELNEIRDENDEKEREEAPSSTLVQNAVQETTSSLEISEKAPQAATKNPKGRKRKRWSDEETRDLLLGVSRFGIGKWKRILHCPDYKFEGRTAVDLKDRFRVCCPGEGLKPRQPKQQDVPGSPCTASSETARQPTTNTYTSSKETSGNEPSTGKESVEPADGVAQRSTHPKLAELGIQTPFAQSTRRRRRGFTAQDDENLWKGYAKYGTAWHSMRDDIELGFGARHPTDLRDRFRIRYSEAFAQAGYKGKAKVGTKAGVEDESNQAPTAVEPRQEPDSTPPNSAKARKVQEVSFDAIDNEIIGRSVTRPSTSRPFSYTSFPIDPGPIFLGDSMPSDKDGPFSPVVLNRDILQWADANTFLMTSPSSSSHTANHDMSMHITIPNDGVHINPLATLKLPMMAYTSHNTFPTASTFPSNYTSNPIPSGTIPRINYPPDTTPSWPSSSSNKAPLAASNALLRTPNLPTIVFPHVPAASARTTMHNLPTPADLLSGMDLDGADGQVPGGGGEHGGGGYEQR